MVNILKYIIERLFKPNYEPESTETVEHDIVIIDGKEVTGDDT